MRLNERKSSLLKLLKRPDYPMTEGQSTLETDLPRATVSNLSGRMRFTLFVYGVFLPTCLFLMSFNQNGAHLGDEPWQSGKIQHYIVLLFKPVAWAAFVPAVLYSMVCLSTLCFKPKLADEWWVRLGIYTGVPLALHFALLLFVLLHVGLMIGTAVVLPVWFGALWGPMYLFRGANFRNHFRFQIWHILVAMTLAAILVAVLLYIRWEILAIPAFLFFFGMLAIPLMNLLAYSYAANHVWSLSYSVATSRRFQIAFCTVWITAYLAALRHSVLVMLDEYSRLPTTDPNCYLASAAAHGHPRLTGAAARGDITLGMRRFKFLELVFKSAMPRTHRALRFVYDRIGPVLARQCRRHNWLASCTCIALKPIEWIAEVVRWWLDVELDKIQRIYRG